MKNVDCSQKLRAERAALWLQLRHVEGLMKDLLSRPVTLNDDQRLTLRLAYEFASVSTTISSDKTDGTDEVVVFDADLLTQIKRQFNIDQLAPEEPCNHWGLDITSNTSEH